jgi:hypothetical protein
MTEEKKLKVEFAPGAFDNFDGTQEELDELMAEIHRMVESGEFLENSTRVDFDELYDEDPELAMKIAESLSEEPNKRPLQ